MSPEAKQAAVRLLLLDFACLDREVRYELSGDRQPHSASVVALSAALSELQRLAPKRYELVRWFIATRPEKLSSDAQQALDATCGWLAGADARPDRRSGRKALGRVGVRPESSSG